MTPVFGLVLQHEISASGSYDNRTNLEFLNTERDNKVYPKCVVRGYIYTHTPRTLQVLGSIKMALDLIVLTVTLFGCCLAADDVTISLKNVDSCNKNYTLGLKNEVTVTVNTDGGDFSNCQVTFIAATQGGTDGQRLCFFIETMDFGHNNNLELEIHGIQSQADPKVYSRSRHPGYALPFEYCTDVSKATVKLQTIPKESGTPNDISLKMVVRHIKSQERIVYLDSGCGQTHDLLGSAIVVLSRQEGSSAPAVSPCTKTFKYVGDEKQTTTYMTYEKRNVCQDFTLRIFDGDDKEFIEREAYNCNNSKPREWRSKSKAIKLELAGDRVQENKTLFHILLKDTHEDPGDPSSASQPNTGFLYLCLLAIVLIF